MTPDASNGARPLAYEELAQLFRERGKACRFAFHPLRATTRRAITWQPLRGWLSDWDLEHEVVALRRAADAGDSEAVWAAIAFLDADPYLFRSGYAKRRLLKSLLKAPLSAEQRETLIGIAERLIADGPRGVGYFREFASLIGAIATTGTEDAVEAQTSSPNPRVAARAMLVLQKIAAPRFRSGRPRNVSEADLPAS
jgi:hypothetical protein